MQKDIQHFYGSDTSLCNHWPFALEPTPSFYSIYFINWLSQVPLFVLSRLFSSLWVSRTGSASDWCALQEALYKCIDTIRCRIGLLGHAPWLPQSLRLG